MITKRNKYFFTLAISSLTLLVLNCKKPPDCSQIKNGKFYYYSKSSGAKVLIDRFDSLQIETDTKKGTVLRSKIVWKNDCKYDMFINLLSQSKLDKADSLFAAKPATVEIVYINPDFYICIAKFSTPERSIEFKDTMYFQK